MVYYFKNNDPIPNTHTDEADIVMSYMDRDTEHKKGQYTFSRYVRANIVDDDNDGDIVIEVNAIDNCNGGIFSIGDILMDAPGGEYVKFSETVRVPKQEIEDRKFEDSVDFRSLSDLLIQDIQEWSDNTAFKSKPKPVPEKFMFDW